MFTQGQAIKFIEKAFGEVKLSNGGLNASVLCPNCHNKTGETNKKKLVIRTDNWLNHCWVCNSRSKSIFHLLQKYNPHLVQEYLDSFDGGSFLSGEDSSSEELMLDEKIKLPNGFYLLAEQAKKPDIHWYAKKALNYLFDRGLTYEDLWFYKIGITQHDKEYWNRVIIPSFDSEGELNFFTSRAFVKRLKPKYFNPKFQREKVIFNELNIDWDKELTLVEGPFDWVKANSNSTCLLGKELTEEYKLFQFIAIHRTPVVLALDPDAPMASMNIGKLLLEYGVPVKIYQYEKDDKRDPGEMTKEAFIAGLVNAIPLTDEDLLRYRIGLL